MPGTGRRRVRIMGIYGRTARCCAGGVGILWGALLLTGCPNPQTYGTPRTVAKGKATHTVAIEGLYFSGKVESLSVDPATGDTVTEEESISGGTPLLPTYQARIGVSNKVDIGIKAANMSSLGTDVKINPVRGDFDLALDPGLQWFGIFAGGNSVNVFYLHLPVLLGFNLSKSSTLVASPGLLYSVATSTFEDDVDGGDAVFQSSGLAARLGVGLNQRISRGFALQPEVTGIRGITGNFGNTQSTIVLIGLGFNIANIPDYSDID